MSDTYKPDRPTHPTPPALALARAGGNAKPAHASVYLLADHLDVLLAACEDIVAKQLTWNRGLRADPQEIAAEKHNLRDDVEDIRKLENTAIMRALKSRERAEEVANVDKRFRQLAKLYVAGTAVLVDAVEECHDSTSIDFATADSIPAYLRSRGLVDPDAPAPTIGADITVGENFLIAKRIAAGALMDLAATFLDALELHYDLFLDENEEPMTPQINRFEDVEEPEALAETPAGSQPDDIGAFIDEVRKEIAAAEQPEVDSAVWSKLGTAAGVGTVVGTVTAAPEDEETPIAAETTDAATEATEDETAPAEAGATEADNDLELVSNDDTRTSEDEIATSQAETADASKASDDEGEVGADIADHTALSTYPEDDEPTEIVGLTKSTSLDDAENDTATTELEAAEEAIADDDHSADMAAEAEANVDDDNTEIEAASEADVEPAEEATNTDTREASDGEDSDDEGAAQSKVSDVTILTAANEDDAEEDEDGELQAEASDADHTDEDNADDDDSGLIITAANDDETADTAQSEPAEAEAEAEAEASADDKIATDATPDESGDEHATADAASAEATSETEAAPSEAESDKKSKSLIDRLSSIRSE